MKTINILSSDGVVGFPKIVNDFTRESKGTQLYPFACTWGNYKRTTYAISAEIAKELFIRSINDKETQDYFDMTGDMTIIAI